MRWGEAIVYFGVAMIAWSYGVENEPLPPEFLVVWGIFYVGHVHGRILAKLKSRDKDGT